MRFGRLKSQAGSTSIAPVSQGCGMPQVRGRAFCGRGAAAGHIPEAAADCALAGLYPALRAARLAPADALRTL